MLLFNERYTTTLELIYNVLSSKLNTNRQLKSKEFNRPMKKPLICILYLFLYMAEDC